SVGRARPQERRETFSPRAVGGLCPPQESPPADRRDQIALPIRSTEIGDRARRHRAGSSGKRCGRRGLHLLPGRLPPPPQRLASFRTLAKKRLHARNRSDNPPCLTIGQE